MSKFVGSALLVLIVLTVAVADEFTASITKFEDGKVTFTKFKKGEKGEATTLPVSAKVKFMKAKFNPEDKKLEADGELEGGKDAFDKQVKEAAAKKSTDDTKKKGFGGGGVFAQIVTEGEGDAAKITEIRVFSFGKKKTN